MANKNRFIFQVSLTCTYFNCNINLFNAKLFNARYIFYVVYGYPEFSVFELFFALHYTVVIYDES